MRQGRCDATKKKKSRERSSGAPCTPRTVARTFTLKPRGLDFGFNIVDFSGILVQKLQVCFRNGGTKPVQEPVISLSKAATSVHNFAHILVDCFLRDGIFENDNVAFILVRDGGHD